MQNIAVSHNPDPQTLKSLGVFNWPIWTKEVSEFPWYYSAQETCYIFEGEVIVAPENDDPINFGKGDLVVFPEGLSCRWRILKDVKKHYKFG
jgi:uncharacterized cupin superfamily protein